MRDMESLTPTQPKAGRRSVRYRLLAIALLPMLVILPILLSVAVLRWNARFDATVISKINGDLTIAHQYFLAILGRMKNELKATAESVRLRDVFSEAGTDRAALTAFLSDTGRSQGFDFLYVVSQDGNIIASDHRSERPIRTDWPVVRSALSGIPTTQVDVFSAAELGALSPDLEGRAAIERQGGEDGSPETRGLVVQAASPVLLPDGRIAAMVGGILLNNNLSFIDTLNNLIYHDAGLPEGSKGTVTIFLDDLRIGTNVRLFESNRAIGTRVSAPVRAAVLGQGRTWLDSAYVVDDWYVSAYEPVVDSLGKRVGMLYVGILQQPFTEAKRDTILGILGAFLIAVAATVPLFLRWASDIFRPLERMSATISRVETGDLGARTGAVKNKDEIGRVALHLDHLLDQIQQQDRLLRDWNDRLNTRVEERTVKLQTAYEDLESTIKQLVMSEKLAAIGQITAGVAHEINNPIAVMQGNLEVVRDLLGSKADVVKEEFRLIDEQIRRVSDIVTRLLQFAKPQEYVGYSDQYDAATVIADTLPLVQHMLKQSSITIEKEFHASRLVQMNRTDLQQVLVNLLVNAIHAMPKGGRLTLRTTDSDEMNARGVAVQIGDTGFGMPAEVLDRIFDPFFTTRKNDGNGLGLSISQMLVTRNGGTIGAVSELEKGTTFTVWLPEVSVS